MEEQPSLFTKIPTSCFEGLSKEDLVTYIHGQQEIVELIYKDYVRIINKHKEAAVKELLLGEQFVIIRTRMFGKSSEKLPPFAGQTGEDLDPPHDPPKKEKKKTIRLPSLRYPDAPLIEHEVLLKELPPCGACGEEMVDSGMSESIELITRVPEQFYVERYNKHKYCCESCHGDVKTAPMPPRIKEGWNYPEKVDTLIALGCEV